MYVVMPVTWLKSTAIDGSKNDFCSSFIQMI